MACDMPGVGADGAGGTGRRRSPPSPTRAAVAVAVVGEREQPLTACWRRSVGPAPLLRSAFDAGERAPRKVLPELGVVRVAGLPVRQLVDVDSPEDLRRYAEAPPHPPTDEQDTP